MKIKKTPKDFIQKYLIDEMKDVVFRHPYLSFSLIAIGIEFLGKCMLTECKTWDIKPGKAYKKGLELICAVDNKYSSLDLKDQLRNGFVHNFAPKSKIILSEVKHDTKHFEKSGERTYLVVEILYRDFVKACYIVLEKEFDNNDKMNKPFIIENI